MRQKLWALCLLCLCLCACAGASPHPQPSRWQGPEVLLQMAVWATHSGTTIPLQALVRLSAEQRQLSLILVYGSTVGHCQLSDTQAQCTINMAPLAPVLASIGEATAQMVHSLAPQGIDTMPQDFVVPPHMQFSAQRFRDSSNRIAWPAHITVHDAARGITLQCAITEVTLL